MSAIFEVQKAVYAKLTGDATLMAMLSGVYDFVQEGTTYPYVTIGDIAASDDSVLGVKGYLLDMNINIYSKSHSKDGCLAIAERILFLLDGQILAVSGFSHVYSDVSRVDTQRNADNETLGGFVAVSILVRTA